MEKNNPDDFDAALSAVAKVLKEHDVVYDAVSFHGCRQLLVRFPIEGGPNVTMVFISLGNEVAPAVFGLIAKTPKKKFVRLSEVCNALNRKYRSVKFYVDISGDINIEYVCPLCTKGDIGRMAFESLIYMKQLLDDNYPTFMKALYTEEKIDI